MAFIKVKDHPGLVRDSESLGILNIDNSRIRAHELQKRARQTSAEREAALEEKINRLEGEVSEVSTKLNQILDLLRGK
jgi:archaellum component FlaC